MGAALVGSLVGCKDGVLVGPLLGSEVGDIEAGTAVG